MRWIKNIPIFLTDITYGVYDNAGAGTSYSGVSNQAESSLVGIYRILLNVGVYAGAAGFLIAFALMMWFATSPKQVAEVKSRAIRICIVMVMIFGVASIVSLVIKAKL